MGFVDQLDDSYDPPSEQELLRRRVERLEQKQREQERRLRRLEEMHDCTDHLRYHRNLSERHREYWYTEGIFDDAINSFQLGYATKCPTAPHSPSYTIPVFDINNKLCNIRHRLVDESAGKYRPHRAGLGQQLFNAPVLSTPERRILLVEGEKKSIVLTQHGLTSVGLMGKSFKWRRSWFDWFRNVGQIVIALDPDATENAWRLGKLFVRQGFDNVSIARFPVKPDDAIVQHHASESDIEIILRNAKKVRNGKR
jgi:DNA primase